MRQAIIVFTKVPEEGRVKTRLTEERGGILTPEEAKLFYEACLYDVLEVCTAMENIDVWICYNADGSRAYLNTMIMQLSRPQNIAGVFKDRGGTLKESMRYAAEFLLKPGEKNKLAESALIVGGDVCGLETQVLSDALGKLEKISINPNSQKASARLLSYHSDIDMVGTIAYLGDLDLYSDAELIDNLERTFLH